LPKSDNSTPYTADIYDTQVRNTIPYYDLFHQATLDLLKAANSETKRWLDTGCGTGTLVQKALPLFQRTNFVLADPSKEMLKTAKKKLAYAPSERVQFLDPTSTQDLPTTLQSFNVITAIQSHHYISNKERIKATEVCFQLLNKDGIYVTFENIRPFTEKGVSLGKENWRNFQLQEGRNPDTVQKHLERFDVEYHPITLEEHLKILRKAGFPTVEILWYSCMQAGFYGVK